MAKIIKGAKKIELTENQILEAVGCKDFINLEKYYQQHIKTDKMPAFIDTDWRYKIQLANSTGYAFFKTSEAIKNLSITLKSALKIDNLD